MSAVPNFGCFTLLAIVANLIALSVLDLPNNFGGVNIIPLKFASTDILRKMFRIRAVVTVCEKCNVAMVRSGKGAHSHRSAAVGMAD